jgi:hypothetical protein
MLLFIPRSLCALKRVAAKSEHARFGATQGIRIALASGLYRAEATDGRRAIVVQGMAPAEDPPWPGFKDTPDDAFEAIILPKDLERACKVGEDFLQSRFGLFGIATVGKEVCLGLGTELVTARTVEGRFPNLNQVVPRKRPLFTFRVDPKILAETLLAMADLLPDEDRAVPFFYYGDGFPLGFCARNAQTGMMIDALVVPFTIPKPAAKDTPTEGKTTEGQPLEAEEPKPNGRRRKKDEPEPAPEANGQAQPGEAPAEEQAGQDAKPDDAPVDGRTAKKARAKAS